MSEKPPIASGYSVEFREAVRSTCLYLATKFGDLDDDLVVVGGLVPTLLIPQQNLPAGALPHVGTMDLDLGLGLGILDEERYVALVDQLVQAGFQPNRNQKDKVQPQIWSTGGAANVTVDFLIQPLNPQAVGGRIFHLEGGKLAAFIIPGLDLAFRDRQRIILDGLTIRQEKATRAVWVCGPGAFVVLKALAFRMRGSNKDAYDLFYLVRNYGTGIGDVAERLRPLQDSEHCQRALEIIQDEFLDDDGLGPRRAAEFLTGGPDANIQADVVSAMSELIRLVHEPE